MVPGIGVPAHSTSGNMGSSGRDSPRYCWCSCWGVGSGAGAASTPSGAASLERYSLLGEWGEREETLKSLERSVAYKPHSHRHTNQGC